MKHERGKIGTALLFAVLIATLAFLSFGSISAAQQHYVNPDESTQGAIDNANAGDTIIVRDGTYTENVDVNVNHLTLKSENGYDSTIVQAANTSDHVFAVTADYVNITEFTVTGATGDYKCGIYLYGAEHCIISDNNASNNYRGIYLYHSSNNSLTNNVVKGNNDQGIRLSSSSNDMLMNNKVMYKGNTGIFLQDSNDNRIIGNNASNSTNYDGIYLNFANNNEIRNNTANYNHYNGIGLWTSSDNNTITYNKAKNNNGKGIYLENSNNNGIYMNNFINNANNVYSNESTNAWNSPSEITYSYNGNTYTHYMGN